LSRTLAHSEVIVVSPIVELTNRHFALLRAVAADRCQLTCSRAPDLYVDGRPSCDQTAVRVLASAGLIRTVGTGRIGQRLPAQLTAAGQDVLADAGRETPSPAGRRPWPDMISAA
jgi:hypothetical protein